MNVQHHKTSIKKIFSLVGVATASAFLALPGVAQLTPNAGDMNQPLNNADSTGTSGELLAQGMPGTERDNVCGGYEGNGTSGGGFYCARGRMNGQFSNWDSQYRRTTPQSNSLRDGNSTTGAGYPGTGVRPQGMDNNMNQDSNNPAGNIQNQTPSQEPSNMNTGGSTTGEGYPGNNVRPQGMDNNMNR